MTTTDTITEEQIETLRAEAGAAGDHLQVSTCRVALGLPSAPGAMTHPSLWEERCAIAECADVIREAELA